MLLCVMLGAKADRPSVGRLEPNTAIGPHANMSTLDRQFQAVRHTAVVPPDPRPVGGTLAFSDGLSFLLNSIGKS